MDGLTHATFKLEHDQLLNITHRMDTRIIDPITRLKNIMAKDVERLGQLVGSHYELAKALYDDQFADGKISVANQTLSIGADQVKSMATQRAKELSDKIATGLERIRTVEEIIENLEKTVVEILGSISVGGKPFA
jgi:hypothetical protein